MPYGKLLIKLGRTSTNATFWRRARRWLEGRLQWFMMKGESEWRAVTSDAPQRVVLGPTPLNSFISELDAGNRSVLVPCTDREYCQCGSRWDYFNLVDGSITNGVTI